MKVYVGTAEAQGFGPVYVEIAKTVVSDLVQHYLLPHDVRHSPEGFGWGYGGAGAAELARCVLLDLVDGEVAEILYPIYKREVIAHLDRTRGWRLTEHSVMTWVRNKSAELALDLTEERLADLDCLYREDHRLGERCPMCGGWA